MPIPDDDAFERTKRTVLRDEARYADQTKKGGKRLRISNCRARNEVWQVTVFGTPTGGTFDLVVNALGTSDTLTFNYNDSAADVKTELATHTNITTSDVDTSGGDFPSAAVNIEFIGDLANTGIPAPTVDFSSLTGGNGVGVLLTRYQPGYPKDGSVAP